MKSLHLPLASPPSCSSRPCGPATWQLDQSARPLVIARGHSMQLHSTAGCVWVTCDGALQDWFLPVGAQMTVSGPACLRLGSAHRHAAAQVVCTPLAPRPFWQALGMA